MKEMRHKATRSVYRRVLPILLVVLMMRFMVTHTSGQSNASQEWDTETLIQTLLEQGVSPAQILGVDSNGIPVVCGTTDDSIRLSPQQAESNGLPLGSRGWEVIPAVIRDDGLETFRVEVDVNGPVASVTIDAVSPFFEPPETPPIGLRDDGLDGDRIAGDFVFTSGPFRFNTARTMPTFYLNDPTSPVGIHVEDLGPVNIKELDGIATRFLLGPSVGLLRSDIPQTIITTLSPNIVVSPHLINISSTTKETQRSLRFLGGSLANLTSQIYDVLPDAFDFFLFFSINKIERLPLTTNSNFNAGVHSSVQVNYTGTGQGLFDNTAFFGSQGKLLGMNVLDISERGVNSNNATHEILHQWVAFISSGLGEGVKRDFAHYDNRTSVGSLVGGFLWTDNEDSTFTIDCNQGSGSGADRAPPLDLYMMGLIDAREVPPLLAYRGVFPTQKCFAGKLVFADEIVTSVTIDDIQDFHGLRIPGPVNAQRDFSVAFVVESHKRLLNATEMTFYNILAEHYTTSIPPQDPNPHLGFCCGQKWVSIGRFFGEGTTWRSDIPIVDLNGDGDVDLDDLHILLADRNMSVEESSCGAPCDLDGDSKITVLDGRKLILLCTRPRCATK